jgi:hypothetical protein
MIIQIQNKVESLCLAGLWDPYGAPTLAQEKNKYPKFGAAISSQRTFGSARTVKRVHRTGEDHMAYIGARALVVQGEVTGCLSNVATILETSKKYQKKRANAEAKLRDILIDDSDASDASDASDVSDTDDGYVDLPFEPAQEPRVEEKHCSICKQPMAITLKHEPLFKCRHTNSFCRKCLWDSLQEGFCKVDDGPRCRLNTEYAVQVCDCMKQRNPSFEARLFGPLKDLFINYVLMPIGQDQSRLTNLTDLISALGKREGAEGREIERAIAFLETTTGGTVQTFGLSTRETTSQPEAAPPTSPNQASSPQNMEVDTQTFYPTQISIPKIAVQPPLAQPQYPVPIINEKAKASKNFLDAEPRANRQSSRASDISNKSNTSNISAASRRSSRQTRQPDRFGYT